MAAKLIVQFTGMMTFVPVNSTPKMLVALIPWTGIGSGSKVHQHRPYLIYDRKYAPVDNHPGPHSQAHHQTEILPLGRTQLSLMDVSGSGDEVDVPSAAVPLRDLTGRSIEAQQLGDAPTESVYAQIYLPGATVPLSAPLRKAKWLFKDKTGETERKLTHQLFWERTLAGDTVDLKFRFFGSMNWKTLRLTAPAGEDIHIEILHLPSKLDDHKLNKDEPAMHFDAYYDLYTTAVTKRYLPYLNEVPGRGVNGASFAREVKSANTFTCMVSQGG